MPTTPKPQDKDEDKDEDGIISNKKPQPRSGSRRKPPSPLLTRVVRRLRDGCAEFVERMEDMEHGYRDKNGKKTEKGLERDYEIERQRKRRDARHKEKEERKGGKDGEGGGGGGGGGAPVEAMMSGGLGRPPPPHGEHSRRGSHGDGRGRSHSRPDPAVPIPAVESFGQGPPPAAMGPDARPRDSRGPGRGSVSALSQGDRGRQMHGSRGSHRDISPMPSEHSGSSLMAQVGARPNGGSAARARQAAPGPGTGSKHPVDSEDEERPGSDDGSSSEDEGEDKAAKAAKAKATTTTGGDAPAAEGSASGLRGGGVPGGNDVDDEDLSEFLQYDDYEDFDDEYSAAAGPSSPHDLPDNASEAEIEGAQQRQHEEPHDEPRGKGKEKEKLGQEEPQQESHEEVSGSLPQKTSSRRTPRPYTNPKVGETTRVKRPGVPGKTGHHQQQKAGKGKKPSQKEIESSSSEASDSDEDRSKSKSKRRTDSSTAESHEGRNHHRTKTGAFSEAGSGHVKTGGSSQAKPTRKPSSNRYSDEDDEDDEDEEDEQDATSYGPYSTPGRYQNNRAEASYRQQSERDKVFTQEAQSRGAASAFKNRGPPYATPTPEHRPRAAPFPQAGRYTSPYFPSGRAPQAGGRYGASMPYSGTSGAEQFFRKPGKVPGEKESPLRNERQYSEGDSQSSEAETDESSGEEDSSDSEPEPTPRRRRKESSPPLRRTAKAKAPPKPAYHDYSSDDSESPPPRKSANKGKARTGKTRARAESPPPKRKPSAKANQGKRRAPADEPPTYKDVVKDAPPNHYARLGLSEDASADEIKKAAKKMRIKTHPDQVRKERPDMTEEEMKKVSDISQRIGESADVLSKPDKKEEYDEIIFEWKRKHGGRLPREDA
ncbi:MAG: hypothetical protein Q9168_006047 [Polycauliona sp. 1 TL-2023]